MRCDRQDDRRFHFLGVVQSGERAAALAHPVDCLIHSRVVEHQGRDDPLAIQAVGSRREGRPIAPVTIHHDETTSARVRQRVAQVERDRDNRRGRQRQRAGVARVVPGLAIRDSGQQQRVEALRQRFRHTLSRQGVGCERQLGPVLLERTERQDRKPGGTRQVLCDIRPRGIGRPHHGETRITVRPSSLCDPYHCATRITVRPSIRAHSPGYGDHARCRGVGARAGSAPRSRARHPMSSACGREPRPCRRRGPSRHRSI